MSGNFDFLKKLDSNLYEIIDEAEHLYRDEYFDQCMAQTRRFAENVCKQALGNKRTTESTFDEMLATLKDNISGNVQGQEFIDDLYFLKKHGNDAVHSSRVQRSGMDALECIQRAFEIAINYAFYNKGAKENVLKLRYDTELLITGKKSKKSLAEKYEETKESTKVQIKKSNKKSSTTKKSKKNEKSVSIFPGLWVLGASKKEVQPPKIRKKQKQFVKQSYVVSPAQNSNGKINFWVLVGFSSFVSLITLLALFVASIL